MIHTVIQDEGASQINVCFMYNQGAAPDGPVAWTWADVAYRGLRVVEDISGNLMKWVPGGGGGAHDLGAWGGS